jgi:AcrR family transcriptional regulator
MAYHHGDLRRALLDAAATAIAEQGPAALSLRDLARRADVSHAAPTHHFGDKAGLLAAFAAEGYNLLAAELAAEWAATHSFLEQGVAYVRFAIQHRAHFEVMFRPDLYHGEDPALVEAKEKATAALYVGATDHPTSESSPVRDVGLAGWSIAHGFATLWTSGALPTEQDPEDLARTVLAQLAPGAAPLEAKVEPA